MYGTGRKKMDNKEALLELAKRKLVLGPTVCWYRTEYYTERFFWLRVYFMVHCPNAENYEDTLKELAELRDLVELACYTNHPELVEARGLLPDMIPKLKDKDYVAMIIRKVYNDLNPDES